MKLRLNIILLSTILILGCNGKSDATKTQSPQLEHRKATATSKDMTQENYDKAIAEQVGISKLRYSALDSANRKKISYLKDFLILYPESSVSYLSFAESDFPGLSVTTTLHDRYEFNMRIPVKYSDDSRGIISYGHPKCYLLEIESVDTRDDGQGGIELGGTSGGNLQKQFGDNEWGAHVVSNGDFSVLGYKLNKNSPVKNFNLVIKHMKSLERIIPIKLKR